MVQSFTPRNSHGANNHRRPQNGLSYVVGARKTRCALSPSHAARRSRDEPRLPRCRDLRQGSRALSWSRSKTPSDEVAAGLLALGIQRGDRVGIWSPNCVEWLLTQFGTARIGVILVNINPAYRVSELEYALNKVSARR